MNIFYDEEHDLLAAGGVVNSSGSLPGNGKASQVSLGQGCCPQHLC